MGCTHPKIKSVNCHIYCMFCGVELPIDYLVGKERIAAQNTADEQQTDNDSTEPAKAVKQAKTGRKTGGRK